MTKTKKPSVVLRTCLVVCVDVPPKTHTQTHTREKEQKKLKGIKSTKFSLGCEMKKIQMSSVRVIDTIPKNSAILSALAPLI